MSGARVRGRARSTMTAICRRAEPSSRQPCSPSDEPCGVPTRACRPGPRAEANLGLLLDECERFAAGRSAEWLVAGARLLRIEGDRVDRGATHRAHVRLPGRPGACAAGGLRDPVEASACSRTAGRVGVRSPVAKSTNCA